MLLPMLNSEGEHDHGVSYISGPSIHLARLEEVRWVVTSRQETLIERISLFFEVCCLDVTFLQLLAKYGIDSTFTRRIERLCFRFFGRYL